LTANVGFGYCGSGGGGSFPEFNNAIGGGGEDVAVSGGGCGVGYGLFVHVGDGVVGCGGDVGYQDIIDGRLFE